MPISTRPNNQARDRAGRQRSGRNGVSVTEVAGLLYCERKAYYDARYGKRTPPEVEARARQGERAHLAFALEGRERASDARCFVASAVYGADAPQTQALRQWRDRALMHSALGRLGVRLYYAVSPTIAAALIRHPALGTLARKSLDALVARIR